MPTKRPLVSLLTAAATTAALASLPACSGPSGPAAEAAASIRPITTTQTVPADATVAAASTTLLSFCTANVALVAPAEDVAAQLQAASLTRALGAPTLLAGDEKLVEKLRALKVKHVLTVGEVSTEFDGFEVQPAPSSAAELSQLTGLKLEGKALPAVASQGEALRALAQLKADTVFEPASASPASPTAPASPSAGKSATIAASEAEFPKLTKPQVNTSGADSCAADELAAGGGSGTAAPTSPSATPSSQTGNNQAMLLVDPETATVVALGNLMVSGIEPIFATDTAQPQTKVALPLSAQVQEAALQAPALVGLGAAFGTPADLQWRTDLLRSGTELPGGGLDLFGGKRYVALYGTPITPALGVLGEQDMDATVKRATDQAATYQGLTEEKVIPALEIIVTVASGAAGEDGNFSNEWPAQDFVPLVEAAAAAGQYVIIDFQPGRADFLTQVKQYEKLLAYPHVGLALDPEWRLGPEEKPLTRIGSVEAAEVNEVIDYLAQFVAERKLPPKMVVLHQFQIQMLRDRNQIHTHRPQTPVLIHADGQGSQHAKQGTWRALHEDAPAHVHWGWKNFIDEDKPMLTPEQTYSQVDPLPDLVTYQ